jgi:hypothetical protein
LVRYAQAQCSRTNRGSRAENPASERFQRLRGQGYHRCRRRADGLVLQSFREQGGARRRNRRALCARDFAPQGFARQNPSPLGEAQASFRRAEPNVPDLGYGRGCLLGNFSAELADQSPLIRERLAALSASWTKDIEEAVREAQADGAISSRTDPADLAAFLLDSYEGALLRARVEKSGAPLDRFMTVAFARLLA